MAHAVSARIDFASPHDPAAPRLRHAFGMPRECLVAHAVAEVRPVLDAVQAHARQGRWCVGYLRYEAAPAFDVALAVRPADGPLAWFGIHDEALAWRDDDVPEGPPAQVAWQASLTRGEFDGALARLHAAIAAGALYQANYTAPLHGTLAAAADTRQRAWALFDALRLAQPGGYAAFIDAGTEQVLSVSPELFFDWRERRLLTRPMKGTAARGPDAQADALAARQLVGSPKERAENVMVVDLLRNDLSRIAEAHSVRVPRLFHAEALPTVWQMTSDVEARTRAGCTLADVFTALFPCGSVTGAPKVAAMQAIRALEPAPRGVYCGAVGVVQPGGAAIFNVPIRTVVLRGNRAVCGIGSGITAGADAEGEWREWQHKRAFVDRAGQPFSLLETLLLADGQVRDAGAHLARMAAAAVHFGRCWPAEAAAQALVDLAQAHPRGAWRVRLLLDADGRLEAQAYGQDATPVRVRLQLADRPFEEAHGEFVRFKTTRRAHYDAFAPTRPGCFDTLLWNTAGELTECTRGNIAFRIGGRWVTPPLACGLLGGVGRARALREGRLAEAVVRKGELPRVEALAFLNSLRGWIEAELD
ncbi:MAG: aminodeoxychorismate synthase component I [Proteobacteria bacterium]|nr:aminodeoxychorismate synthase component I [Pseudomonadota bacterium]